MIFVRRLTCLMDMVEAVAVSVLMMAGETVMRTSDTMTAAWWPFPAGALLFRDTSSGDRICRKTRKSLRARTSQKSKHVGTVGWTVSQKTTVCKVNNDDDQKMPRVAVDLPASQWLFSSPARTRTRER